MSDASYAAAGVDIEAGDRAVQLMESRIAAARRPEVVGGLGGFAGAGRRFERLGRTRQGAEVVDDYAHHPTEVRALLDRHELTVDTAPTDQEIYR